MLLPPATPSLLDWTREESSSRWTLRQVGAFTGGPIPGQTTAQIIQLSNLLRKLSAYPPELQGEKYRNPDGVYLKLMNLRAIQTVGAARHERVQPARRGGLAGVRRRPATTARRSRGYPRAVEEGTIKPATSGHDGGRRDRATAHRDVHGHPSGEPRAAERAEQNSSCATATTWQSRASGPAQEVPARRRVRPIYSDAWVEDRHALIEAKNSDSRDAIVRPSASCTTTVASTTSDSSRDPAPLSAGRRAPGPASKCRNRGIWPTEPGFRDSADGVFT